MNKFEVGDRVVCISADKEFDQITEGNTYVVLDITVERMFEYLKITRDDGTKYEFMSYRFELSPETIRKRIIEEILK